MSLETKWGLSANRCRYLIILIIPSTSRDAHFNDCQSRQVGTIDAPEVGAIQFAVAMWCCHFTPYDVISGYLGFFYLQTAADYDTDK